jgi:arylsulfatase
MAQTIPLVMPWDENFDVGADTGTPVEDKDYQIPFRFTGTLSRLILRIEPPVLTTEDKKQLQAGQREGAAARQ